ncbi:ENTH-domain-containing protein [Vararia minispora EC-137]|uniref:ENTH-domain-containing protein n=1 Tax=Vararia minispora EC-137 TaxID=1314806 RepID=A0ACB8Q6Y4_9AGAM|nr:ENTH-domain-containing protein [Vararia minispora EC-137]
MDRLTELGNTLSNLTMYDIKSMYNQAKNVVLNVSEMEAKVREATNDDPWGASSTLMTEIAQGCVLLFLLVAQNFNEIMPCIYSQFMEKEARQWRQIYKALQLLEYLVKHGSERVVDDARSHISTLKMLRSFHYIDDKGKDQGINGTSTRASRHHLLVEHAAQSGTVPANLSSFFLTWRRFAPSAARPRPTRISTLARVTME